MEFDMYKGKLLIKDDSIPNKSPLEDIKNIVIKKDKMFMDREAYINILLYIYFMCDLSKENPLKDLDKSTKRSESLKQAFGTSDFDIAKEYGKTVYSKLEKGMVYYETKVVTDAQKDIHTFNKKMDQLRVMLLDTEPTIKRNINDKNGAISFATNIDIINSTLKDIVEIIQAKSSLNVMYIRGTVPNKLRGSLTKYKKRKNKK